MSGTILIVDDVATNRIVLKVKLAAACYDTLQAADGTAALAVARRALPDLVLLDVMLPDLSGIEVCRRLKADPATRDIPVVMITAGASAEARMQALRAGADDFLARPVEETMLMARIRSLLRARETEAELRLRDATARAMGFAEPEAAFEAQGTVGLIAPDRETGMAWRRALAPHVAARLAVIPAEAALSEAALSETGAAPDVYLIAADLAAPGGGLRLMSELRSRAPTRHAMVCIALPAVTGAAPAGGGGGEAAAMALDLGAADLLRQPLDPEETGLRLTAQLRRKRQADRLRESLREGLQMAVTDPLTGLYNRRYALPHLARMAERARQTGRRYAVMLLDLDRFKAVNDRYGHAAGDAVLSEVAQRLQASLRPVDLIARIGGEEFLVAMPDTTLASARATAERLRRAMQEVPVALPASGHGAAPSPAWAAERAAARAPLQGPVQAAGPSRHLPPKGDAPRVGPAGFAEAPARFGSRRPPPPLAPPGSAPAAVWPAPPEVMPPPATAAEGGPDPQGPLPAPAAVAVTVSIGLALGGPDPRNPAAAVEPPESVMARADAALLLAKAEGRNQVTVGRSAA